MTYSYESIRAPARTIGGMSPTEFYNLLIQNNPNQDKVKLFEYVAFFVPKKDQKDAKGVELKPAILLDDKMLEESEETVKRKAIRAIPKEYEDLLEQVTVVVRVFR